jgi:hypothetical protein
MIMEKRITEEGHGDLIVSAEASIQRDLGTDSFLPQGQIQIVMEESPKVFKSRSQTQTVNFS